MAYTVWCVTYDSGGSVPTVTRLDADTLVCIDGVTGPPPAGRNLPAPILPGTYLINSRCIAINCTTKEIIYGTQTTNTVKIVNYETLTGIRSVNLASVVGMACIASDDNYIYAVRNGLRQYDKVTGAEVAQIYSAGAGAFQVSIPIQLHVYKGYLYLFDQNNDKLMIGEIGNFGNTVVVPLSISGTSFVRGGVFDRNSLFVTYTDGLNEYIAKYIFALPSTVGGLVTIKTIATAGNAATYGVTCDPNYVYAFMSNNALNVTLGNPAKSVIKFDKDLNYITSSISYNNTINGIGATASTGWYASLEGEVSYAASFAAGRGRPRRFIKPFNPADII